MKFDFSKMTAEEQAKAVQCLIDTAHADANKSYAAQMDIAKAIETPLRKGLLSGDIINGIFQAIVLGPGATSEFPLDFFTPGNANDFAAYTIPNEGRIPERHVEGDRVMVPTYDIGSSIDWLLKYAREARWDIVSRAMEVLEAGFVKKMNDDGWHVLLSAGVDRNIVVYDSTATAGLFTKRLVSLMKLIMRRNSGGNSATPNRGRMTHLFVSPEAMEDIRTWGVDQVDDVTRREIFVAADGTYNKVFGVTLVDIDELGVSQEYQTYFASTLPGTMGAADVEVCVGLDLSKNDSFVMPVKQNVEVYPDPTMHRQRREGFYATAELGFAALDNRRVLLGSM